MDSKKAEVNSNFSSYQTLTMDNDFVVKLRANEARKKVLSNFSSYQTLTMDNDFVVKLHANEARKKGVAHERQ